MSIASAVQIGTFVYLFDEHGGPLAVIPSGEGPDDGLIGFTGSTVSIRRGSFAYTYNERGNPMFVTSAR
jgi:hypothetical protein